jgi:hypothetical protein
LRYFCLWVRNQALGGGRTEAAIAGRNRDDAEVSNLVINTARITGTGDALAVLSFALGVEQI